jgi:hypothetical protein
MRSLSACALLSVWCLVLLCLPLSSSAFYTEKDGITELTTHNFAKEVLKSDDAWLVEFYVSSTTTAQPRTAAPHQLQ